MKFSAKLQAPVELTDWLALANDDWQPTYDDLRGAQKRATHDSLLQEQGFVCCYCGASLPENRDDSHIEHFRPQSRFPQDALDYTNMFASCGPPKATAIPQTCGANKAAWYDAASHVIPSDPNCE